MPNSMKNAAPMSTEVMIEKGPPAGVKKDNMTPTKRPNHMPLRAPERATRG
ncbi:hypothetical protein D3C84_1228120 [compost metagenome]